MLKKMELFDLANVPAEMQECIYSEERKRGSVYCLPAAYMVVLALRWILQYTEDFYDSEFETWRVYWQTEGDYGFRTRIILCKDKQDSYEDTELVAVQEQCWVILGTLECSDVGVIRRVRMGSSQPYDRTVELDGQLGIRRLIEDAACGSRLTHHDGPFSYRNGKLIVSRCHYEVEELRVDLKGEYDFVTSEVTLTVTKPWRY